MPHFGPPYVLGSFLSTLNTPRTQPHTNRLVPSPLLRPHTVSNFIVGTTRRPPHYTHLLRVDDTGSTATFCVAFRGKGCENVQRVGHVRVSAPRVYLPSLLPSLPLVSPAREGQAMRRSRELGRSRGGCHVPRRSLGALFGDHAERLRERLAQVLVLGVKVDGLQAARRRTLLGTPTHVVSCERTLQTDMPPRWTPPLARCESKHAGATRVT